MKKHLIGLAFLMCMGMGNANWLWTPPGTTGPVGNFSVKDIGYTPSAGGAAGGIIFWVNEYPSNPDTRFYFNYSATGGLEFEQASLFISMLMTAKNTGGRIQIHIPGVGPSDTDYRRPALDAANQFSSLLLVQE